MKYTQHLAPTVRQQQHSLWWTFTRMLTVHNQSSHSSDCYMRLAELTTYSEYEMESAMGVQRQTYEVCISISQCNNTLLGRGIVMTK